MTTKQAKLKWYNVHTSPYEPGSNPGQPKKGGRMLPPAVRRKLAQESSAGGRCQCHNCGEFFSVTYCKVVEISWRVTDWLCADCRAQMFPTQGQQ